MSIKKIIHKHEFSNFADVVDIAKESLYAEVYCYTCKRAIKLLARIIEVIE